MQIQEITVFSYDVLYQHGIYRMSGGRSAAGHPSIIVRIRTNEGLEGWAETTPNGSDYLPSSFTGELAAIKELSPKIIGLDPRCPVTLNSVMDKAMMAGIAAKAVIDFACYDITGKALGVPTHTLLGGSFDSTFRGYSIIPLDHGVDQALMEINKGFKAMQIKAGDNVIDDARRARAIRLAVPAEIDVWVDANGGWSFEEALIFARTIGNDIALPIEQPCRTISDCIEVGRRSGLPIILDESIGTMADLVAAHAGGIAGINLKLSRVGGFTKARIIRDAAIELGMMVGVGDTWGCALTTAQNIQLGASTLPNRLRAIDLYTEWTKPLIANIPRMQANGRTDLTASLGNGITSLDAQALGDPIFHVDAMSL